MDTADVSIGSQVVTEVENTLRSYLALDSGLQLVLALWALATHVFECFDAFAYIAITSPTKRCGKTRLAEIMEFFCANGLRTVSATPAAIFRTIQMHRAKDETVTLIIDEAEVLGLKGERAEALREILNAGYKKGQYVLRCKRSEGDKENFEPQQFETYCPKIIVLIGNLNDTLADRCIPVRMRRRKQHEQVERLFLSRAERLARGTRNRIERWAKAHKASVKRKYRGDLDFLEDREAELWLPIFAVCRVVAPERLDELKVTALGISRRKQTDEPAELGVLLLRDIRDAFERGTTDRISTIALLCALSEFQESPWASWDHGRGIDARSLARLLRPFRIEPRNLRLEDQIVKGYMREDFDESWASYLSPAPSATPLQEA